MASSTRREGAGSMGRRLREEGRSGPASLYPRLVPFDSLRLGPLAQGTLRLGRLRVSGLP
jgi:hypothetical protein